jgi:hypothetical protein
MEPKYAVQLIGEDEKAPEKYNDICCFKRFIEELLEYFPQ